MTSSYLNAYHSCSMMVRFKLQRCTIYESVAVIGLVTIRIHAYYEFKASRAIKFAPCGSMKFFQNSIARPRPAGLLFVRGWNLHSILNWRAEFYNQMCTPARSACPWEYATYAWHYLMPIDVIIYIFLKETLEKNFPFTSFAWA